MRTSVKVVLAAIGAAVVAYPVMAETVRNGYVQPDVSTDNVFWGIPYPAHGRPASAYERPAYGHPYGYGSVGRPTAGHRYENGPVAHPPIIDCVHVTFPNCSGGG
jgi:hypothetical protein